ncbi:MAG: hypothetical protein QG549_295 [Patescibacteria group bacterium]|jgi:hypothetical protein|nr:hypothetical protein [Patescibacteria group bacterium]
MSHRFDVNQREQGLKNTLSDLALTDRELFRTQATSVLRGINRTERESLKRLETENLSAYDVLILWYDNLSPVQKTLKSKLTNKAFRSIIKNNLLLDESIVDTKIQDLIDTRLEEVLVSFLHEHYPHKSAALRYAERLLHNSDHDLNKLLSILTEFILYKIVAKENNIIVLDPHASIIKRISCRIRIAFERKKTIQNRNERLSYITRRQSTLLATNNGILAEILDKEWDLVTVISMRNQYEKRVNALPKTDNTAIKRLAIFEKITQQFRDDYIEKTASKKVSLELTRKLSEEVDTLLLKIFDLSNVQKNQLLICSKEYRELKAEHKSILVSK